MIVRKKSNPKPVKEGKRMVTVRRQKKSDQYKDKNVLIIKVRV